MYSNIEYDKTVEVLGDTLKTFITALPTGQKNRTKILEKHGVLPENGQWYNLENVIKAYHEIGENVGSSTLFMLGIGIAEKAQFPPYENLEQALNGINIGYHMCHRLNGREMLNTNTGKLTQGIGNYTCTSFDNDKREAILLTDNPYPSKLDEGIITQTVRLFKPSTSISHHVRLDTSKETRDTDGKSCTFVISW